MAKLDLDFGEKKMTGRDLIGRIAIILIGLGILVWMIVLLAIRFTR
jgi:hypothetical protein